MKVISNKILSQKYNPMPTFFQLISNHNSFYFVIQNLWAVNNVQRFATREFWLYKIFYYK